MHKQTNKQTKRRSSVTIYNKATSYHIHNSCQDGDFCIKTFENKHYRFFWSVEHHRAKWPKSPGLLWPSLGPAERDGHTLRSRTLPVSSTWRVKPSMLVTYTHMEVSIHGGYTQNGWFKEKSIKMDDLGGTPFMETPIWPAITCDYVEFSLEYSRELYVVLLKKPWQSQPRLSNRLGNSKADRLCPHCPQPHCERRHE